MTKILIPVRSNKDFRPRVAFGKFLIRFGAFIESLAVVVMKPEDLIEFSRRTYSSLNAIEYFAQDSVVNLGLKPQEEALFKTIPLKEGRMLVLGVGGGREAIYFARNNYKVTGVDIIPTMLEKFKENAEGRGLQVEGLVQDISKLDVPAEAFDVVWISANMYSCIPTKNRRRLMLKSVARALKPGGYFALQLRLNENFVSCAPAEFIKKALAFLTVGNIAYETGDAIWLRGEFLHTFVSEEQLKFELEAGGFKVIALFKDKMTRTAEGLLQKNPLI